MGSPMIALKNFYVHYYHTALSLFSDIDCDATKILKHFIGHSNHFRFFNVAQL